VPATRTTYDNDANLFETKFLHFYAKKYKITIVFIFMLDIQRILQIGEGLHSEFKTSFKEDVIESLVAFSNAKGGVVYIGISDNADISGVNIGKETIQNWINEVKNKKTPQIIPDAEIHTVNSKAVVSFYVMEYPIKPVSTRGRYYKRVGNSNHLLSVNEVSNMHLQTVNSSWDYYPRPGKTIEDISLEKVEKVMNIIMQRNSNLQFDSAEEFLTKNELLLGEHKISNGCYLMFCKEDNLFTTIQLGLFASEIVIKDDVTNSGDILTQVDEVMSFVRKHINKELIITGKQIENIQRWQYPLEGIRELVLNMIIHRDYTSAADSIVKIFTDHILFFNPGGLPDSITIEQLLTNNYVSTPRNRQIAKIVKEMGLIEKYGTGIKRVRNMFVDYGLKQPLFEIIPGGFAATVFADNNDTVENITENVVENDVENDVEGVVENEQLIIKLLNQNKSYTSKELAKNLNKSERTIQRYLNSLTSKNRIARVGPDKGGYWEIVK
jgi:ATP-dependent DNA helicase RecG